MPATSARPKLFSAEWDRRHPVAAGYLAPAFWVFLALGLADRTAARYPIVKLPVLLVGAFAIGFALRSHVRVVGAGSLRWHGGQLAMVWIGVGLLSLIFGTAAATIPITGESGNTPRPVGDVLVGLFAFSAVALPFAAGFLTWKWFGVRSSKNDAAQQ
jgi:hypothetical protein